MLLLGITAVSLLTSPVIITLANKMIRTDTLRASLSKHGSDGALEHLSPGVVAPVWTILLDLKFHRQGLNK